LKVSRFKEIQGRIGREDYINLTVSTAKDREKGEGKEGRGGEGEDKPSGSEIIAGPG